MRMKNFFWLVLLPVVIFLISGAFPASGDRAESGPENSYYGVLAPTPAQVRTNHDVVYRLSHRHYRHLEFDDQLSARVYERYLNDLDNSHSYFLASDVAEFDPYRLRLDDALKKDDLEPAFKIFNRYQQRFSERLIHLLALLEQNPEEWRFDLDEEIELQRDQAPWPADMNEMNDLWRKRLKGMLLDLKLTGKSMEESVAVLTKRYRNQLNRLNQNQAEDVFNIYMNTVAGVFDPHTQYLSPRNLENFDINMSLSLEGIGALLQTEEEYIKVVRLIPAGPAEKGKVLKAGDRIVGVGQGPQGEVADVVGWRLDEVVERIRGPKGSLVRLEVIPADAEDRHQTQIIEIVRDTVKLEEQAAKQKIVEMEHQGRTLRIGVVDIPTFYADFNGQQAGQSDYKSTTRDVRRLLAELHEAKVDAVIVDLRDNGGGSLQEAETLSGLFIETGPVVQIRDAGGSVNVLRDPDPAILYRGPLAVVVNHLSASASEIFAGAIQDYQRGIVIGEQTFGKGTVQALLPLKQGQLKTTTAKFYRISGGSTQHRGVVPDIDYPSLFDFAEVGESALKEALPWDSIRSAEYGNYDDFADVLDRLRLRHRERMQQDPDYAYLQARKARLGERRLKKTVSLNEKIRLQEKAEAEQWRLEVENTLRLAKKLPLIASVEELDKEQHDLPEEFNPEADPVLLATGLIMLDFVTLRQADMVMQ